MSSESPHSTAESPVERWVALAQRVLACARALREELSCRAAAWPVSEQEFLLLWNCREAPADGVGQTELAARLAVSAAQVSGLVERLRCGGMLECRRAAHDRRRQLWRLTSAGHATLDACLADLAALAQRLNRRMRGEAVRALCRRLDRVLSGRLPPADLPQRGAA